jgi:hypothetical protein
MILVLSYFFSDNVVYTGSLTMSPFTTKITFNPYFLAQAGQTYLIGIRFTAGGNGNYPWLHPGGVGGVWTTTNTNAMQGVRFTDSAPNYGFSGQMEVYRFS